MKTSITNLNEEFSGIFQIIKQMTNYLYVNIYIIATYHVKLKKCESDFI